MSFNQRFLCLSLHNQKTRKTRMLFRKNQKTVSKIDLKISGSFFQQTLLWEMNSWDTLTWSWFQRVHHYNRGKDDECGIWQKKTKVSKIKKTYLGFSFSLTRRFNSCCFSTQSVQIHTRWFCCLLKRKYYFALLYNFCIISPMHRFISKDIECCILYFMCEIHIVQSIYVII